MHNISQAFVAGAVLLFTLACLVLDVRSRRIPNWLTVPVLATGLLVYTACDGLSGLWFSFLGFATGFGVLFVLWLFGGGGGGDVKMMGALGAWLGASLTVQVFVISAMVTAMSVCCITIYSAVVERAARARRVAAEGAIPKKKTPRDRSKAQERPGRVVPYAVPMAVGAWVVLAVAWRFGTLFYEVF